jgi:hypothetical protein
MLRDHPRMDLAALAVPCTRPGRSPVDLRDPADALALAPRAPVLVPALASADLLALAPEQPAV